MLRARANGFALDLRQAVRRLRRSPALVAVAALALGVGAAAAAAVFRVAEAAFFTALPGVERQEELVALGLVAPRAGGSTDSADAPLDAVRELGELRDTFARVAGFVGHGVALDAGGGPELAIVQIVTRDYFPLLGVRAAHGRLLDPARTGEPELVLSDRSFRRHFAGDPSAIGRSVSIGGRPFSVVGVAPPGFEGTFLGFPFAGYLSIESGAALLPPIPALELVARLAPGVSLEAARARLATVPAPADAARAPGSQEGLVWRARPLDGLDPSIAGGLRALVVALAALAILVLGTAASNVGGLLAARAIERRGELGLRSALGAPRHRLLRPLWLEACLLGLAGAGAALVLAVGSLALLARLVPRFSIPLAIDLMPGMATAVAAIALAWTLGTLAGLAPAAIVARGGAALRPLEALGLARGARRTRRLRAAFVVGQLAIALVLVAAGIALGRGVATAGERELGFEPLLLRSLDLETAVLPGDAASRLALASDLERRARESGAVESAGLVSRLPFSFGRPRVAPRLDDGTEGPLLDAVGLSPGALEALGVALVDGRDFRANDTEATSAVAILDRAAAERLWPRESALGRRLRVGSPETEVEIVGVVEALRWHRPWLEPSGLLARPVAQSPGRRLALVVRSRESAVALDRVLLPALAAAVPALPLDRFVPAAERVELVQLPQRIAGRVAGVLSAAALALAAIGLAGLVARLAAERRREFAIRLALGADARSIARLVLGESVRFALRGAAIGLPLAVGVGFALAAALERVAPADPIGLGAAAGLVTLLALAAALIPARRASAAAPADILRE